MLKPEALRILLSSTTILTLLCSPAWAQEEAFECRPSESATLSCPGVKTIDIDSAFYGRYGIQCGAQCCNRTATDCVEDMATDHPSSYAEILNSCQNQTTCSVQYNGASLLSCSSPYLADYMMIYYRCLPEDPTTPTTTTTTTTTTTPVPTRRPSTASPGGGGGGGGTPVGAIVGGVLAGILLIVLIVLLIYLFYRLKKKPPPKKNTKVRMVKRPSNVARPPPGHAQQPRPLSTTSQTNGKPTTTPGQTKPVPPYVAYENKAFDEQEVDLVLGKKPASNGLAGSADLSGNAPKLHPSSKKYMATPSSPTAASPTQAPPPNQSNGAAAASKPNNTAVPNRPNKPPTGAVKLPSKGASVEGAEGPQVFDTPPAPQTKAAQEKQREAEGDNPYEQIDSSQNQENENRDTYEKLKAKK